MTWRHECASCGGPVRGYAPWDLYCGRWCQEADEARHALTSACTLWLVNFTLSGPEGSRGLVYRVKAIDRDQALRRAEELACKAGFGSPYRVDLHTAEPLPDRG